MRGGAAPPDREPDPQGRVADDVGQQHERPPPELDHRLHRLLAQVEPRDVEQAREAEQEDPWRLADDHEQQHYGSLLTAAIAPVFASTRTVVTRSASEKETAQNGLPFRPCRTRRTCVRSGSKPARGSASSTACSCSIRTWDC